MNSGVIHRFGPARLLGALGIGVLLIAVAVSPTFADSPNRGHGKFREGVHPGCHGIANAYSHVLANAADDSEGSAKDALKAVAEKKGCDLSAVKPATHPNGGDEDVDEVGNEADGEGGPPAEVVAAKCDRIADKLVEAEARTHGNSAEAFTRQADKWSCH